MYVMFEDNCDMATDFLWHTSRSGIDDVNKIPIKSRTVRQTYNSSLS